VSRHRSHIGVVLAEAAQRRAELEDDLGDDLLGQMKGLTRDLRRALEDAKQAKSLPAFLQVVDRMQKQVALQSQLLERAAGDSAANTRYAINWIDGGSCPHHPDGCPSNGFASPSMAAVAPAKGH